MEMATVIENGAAGYINTDIKKLIKHMQDLQANPELAHQLGIGAQKYAMERFHIQRFIADWNATLNFLTN